MQTAKMNGHAARAAREDAGLTLKSFHQKVIKQLGRPVHIDHLRKIEQGVRQPGPELFRAIRMVLSVGKEVLCPPERAA